MLTGTGAGPVSLLLPPPCLEWPSQGWNTCSVFNKRLNTRCFPSHWKWNHVIESKLWGNVCLNFVNAWAKFPPQSFCSSPTWLCTEPIHPSTCFFCVWKIWAFDMIGWEHPNLNLRVSMICWGTKDYDKGLRHPTKATLCPEGGCRKSSPCWSEPTVRILIEYFFPWDGKNSPLILHGSHRLQHQLLWPPRMGNCPSPFHVPGILCVQEDDTNNILFWVAAKF